ncbi:hypothetical protein C2S52_018680 [Perilla frutescens var. hirtella]|uniref:Uncharacterized protein n=1 Tax=Perilla frutescens var. hirtella TaxID=608512 RepID=A0AAD4IZT4_PERFH|nr:hypothetical protein C2S52_018680 [Perilla frutescens var. hirtella]KAH6812356.1 hypothetical protein C2S51_026118 [Perilla frutescens var. frutescens]KAH6824160.1 hypothetical protein C2S53_000597 [Perilla frutescens var. hirtella]
MATSALPLLLFISLLAATSSARPCKTIFYFSATTTTTYYPYNSYPENPNPNSALRSQNPRYLTLIFTSTTANPFPNRRPSLDFKSDPSNDDSHSSAVMTSSDFPLKFYSSVSSSIRDRTKDIMSVVGALLFGVGCGALTGAIMYFLWALFSPGRFDFVDVSDDDEDYEDDVAATKKKLGYVAIPANTDDLKKPAPPAKEVV